MPTITTDATTDAPPPVPLVTALRYLSRAEVPEGLSRELTARAVALRAEGDALADRLAEIADGLSAEAAARLLGVSSRTVKRERAEGRAGGMTTRG